MTDHNERSKNDPRLNEDPAEAPTRLTVGAGATVDHTVTHALTLVLCAAAAAISTPRAQGQTFGGFAPQVTFPVGNGPFSVAMGDLNGDGALDIATANRLSNTVSILRNYLKTGKMSDSACGHG